MELEELKQKISELEKASEAKTTAISISAHELKTLLTSLKWVLRMILDGDVGAVATEQKHLLSKGYENTERMISIAQELLTASHTEDILTADIQKTEEDIVALIESALFDFTGESYKKQIELIFLKPEELLPKVFINKDRVRVIIQNLVENAIKYSVASDRIFVSITPIGDMLRITIKDTGIGIPPGDQPHIFDKFYRAENARTHEIIGTGLGLYTSKLIAEKEGGMLTFVSKEKTDSSGDHGSSFMLDLPAAVGLPIANKQ